MTLLKLNYDSLSAPGKLAEGLCAKDTMATRQKGNYLWVTSPSERFPGYAIDTPWEAEYKKLRKSFQVSMMRGSTDAWHLCVGSVYAKSPRAGLTNAEVVQLAAVCIKGGRS